MIARGISVVVKNDLDGDVSDLCVLYAESNLRKINVETGENVVWKQNVNFNARTVPGKTEIASMERIEFSGHQSYWQVYYTYDNNCYKLEKDNAQFNLHSTDNGTNVIVTIGPTTSVSFVLLRRKKVFTTSAR